MAYFVSQAFYEAVTTWEEAAAVSGGAAKALWEKVLFEGKQLGMGTKAKDLFKFVDAVRNGEACVIARGRAVTFFNAGLGAGEAGMATLAGVGIGVGLCVLVVACVYVHNANCRDMNETLRAANEQYRTQYYPRYVTFVANSMRLHPGYAVPQPLTFKEFVELRGSRMVSPARLNSDGV